MSRGSGTDKVAHGPAGSGVVASGVDVVSIDRIAALVGRFEGSFLERVYTPAERAYCSARPRPAQHYAARWAAKEAAIKALSGDCGPIPVGSVAVLKDGEQPRLEFSGNAEAAATALAERVGVDRDGLHAGVSLAHDRDADAAVAHVVVGRRGGGR